MKWSASLLDSSFGFTVLDVGVDPFIFMISRQICVDFISASLLHKCPTVASSCRALRALYTINLIEL